MTVTQNTANFPGPNAPIDQAGEVILSQPWFQFFLALLNRTGGNGTPSSDFAGLWVAVKAVQAQADYQSVVLQDPAVQTALQRIAELAAEMLPAPDLRPLALRLDDFEARALDPAPDLSALLRRLDDLDARLLDAAPAPIAPPLEPWNAPTLANGWANFGGGFNPAGYWKDPAGVVHLRGLLASGTLNGAAAMFTLPAGYRPANTEMFVAISNNAVGRVDVRNTGDVVPTIGSNTNFSLDGMTFRAA